MPIREALPDDKTAWEAISGGLDILTVGKFEMPSRAYLGRFNFKGPDQQKMVGKLSGGERGRLHLARTLLAGGNVLLLDEPSNDLDVETLRALEEALLQASGNQQQRADFAAESAPQESGAASQAQHGSDSSYSSPHSLKIRRTTPEQTQQQFRVQRK